MGGLLRVAPDFEDRFVGHRVYWVDIYLPCPLTAGGINLQDDSSATHSSTARAPPDIGVSDVVARGIDGQTRK